jgi:hypothetical protein
LIPIAAAGNRRRRLLLAGGALALLLVLGAVAVAAVQAAGTVTVVITGQGSATGEGINCNQSGEPLKLTRAGERLLRGGRRVKGKLSAGFARTGGGSLTRTRGVTLKRA